MYLGMICKSSALHTYMHTCVYVCCVSIEAVAARPYTHSVVVCLEKDCDGDLVLRQQVLHSSAGCEHGMRHHTPQTHVP